MSLKTKLPDDNFCTPTQPAKKSRISALNRSISDKSPAITIPASPFMQKLGYGTGVSVYLFQRSPKKSGILKSPWAVKKIKAHPRTSGSLEVDIDTKKRLEREAGLLKTLKHECIIGYRAFTKSSDGTLCLSMEKGEKSLMDLIEERRDETEAPFPVQDITKVALAVARALSYIHNEHKLLHGDLKSGNVLVQGPFENIKLCDFGVAVKMKDDLSDVKDESECYIGTEPWRAMEVIDDGTITDKTDMFSYGLVLWEMLSLEVPHMQMYGNEDYSEDDSYAEDTFDESLYLESLGTLPPLPEYDYDESYQPILQLLSMCTNEDPKLRPSAREVVDMLEKSAEGDKKAL